MAKKKMASHKYSQNPSMWKKTGFEAQSLTLISKCFLKFFNQSIIYFMAVLDLHSCSGLSLVAASRGQLLSSCGVRALFHLCEVYLY